MGSRTIDPRYVPTTIAVAANTPSSAPQSTDPALGACIVEQVEIFIPPGHAGLTGLAIQLAGTHVVPYGAPTDFVLGDDATLTFELGVEVGGDLRVITYNADVAFAHTFYLRWKVRSLTSNATGSTAPPMNVVPLPIVQAG